jgi:hypothetical protein
MKLTYNGDMSEEYLTYTSELYHTSVHDKEGAIGLQAPNRAGTAASFTLSIVIHAVQSKQCPSSCRNLCRLDLRLGVWRCIHGRILEAVYADLCGTYTSSAKVAPAGVVTTRRKYCDGMFITVYPLLYGASNHVPKRATCRSHSVHLTPP